MVTVTSLIRDTLLKLKLYSLVNYLGQKKIAFERKFIDKEKYQQRLKSFYEFHKLHVKKGDLVFDIGANVGDFTHTYLKLGAKKVIAVEPQSKVIEGMKKRFQKTKKVEIVKAGIDNKLGKKEIMICEQVDKVSTFSKDQVKNSRLNKTHTWSSSEMVNMITIDSMIEKYGNPDFIKIDVEGFEKQAIQGLSQKVKLIQFEILKENLDDALWIIDHLDKLGMKKVNALLHFGEEDKYFFKEYITAKEMISFLKNCNYNNLAGDIFVKE